MKLEPVQVPTMRSGGIKETEEFTMKPTAEAFRILSAGMYTNPVAAIIRELSCNAWDSHVMAGNDTTPFDISLPTRFSPLFRIRDYGTGLSHEDIMKLYVTYFDSTKTNDNTQIGALGIGSKSPLGYTNSFSVVSIQDGVKRIYSVFIGDDDSENPGFPGIAFTGEVPTDENNGLEISVPTQEDDFRKWDDAARKIFKWFPVRPDFTNEDYIIPKIEIVRQVGKVCITDMDSNYRGEWNVIQGNIAYPLDLNLLGNKYYEMYRQMSGHIVVSIGDVMMAANRETLTYTEKTVACLKEALDEFENDFVGAMLKELDATDSYPAALKIYREAKRSHFLKASQKLEDAAKAKIRSLLDWMYDEEYKDGEEPGVDDRRFLNNAFNPAERTYHYDNKRIWSKNAIARICELALAECDIPIEQVSLFGIESAGYNSSKKHKVKLMDLDWIYGHSDYLNWNQIHLVFNDGTRSAKGTFATHCRVNNEYMNDSVVLFINNKDVDASEVKKIKDYLEDKDVLDSYNVISKMDIETGGGEKSGSGTKCAKVAELEYWPNCGDDPKWNKGCDLQPLIDDNSKNYYWFTVKNVTPQDMDGKCPKSFVREISTIAGVRQIYGVKERDVPTIQSLPNWIHVNNSLDSIIKEKLTDKLLAQYINLKVFGPIRKWQKLFKNRDHLLKTIEHKGFKELMRNYVPSMDWDDKQNVDTLLGYTKRNNIKVKMKGKKELVKQRESVYNDIIGIKLILLNVTCPDTEDLKEVIKLVNHFATNVGEVK